MEHKAAILIEHLYSMIVTIRDDYTTFIIHGDAEYAIEFADFCSFFAKLEISFTSVDDINFERTSLDVFVSHRDWNLKIKQTLTFSII